MQREHHGHWTSPVLREQPTDAPLNGHSQASTPHGWVGRWLGRGDGGPDAERRSLERRLAEAEASAGACAAELDALRLQVGRAARMAALGSLSAGLAHDAGNLLARIRLGVDALERAGLTGDLPTHVYEIGSASAYLGRLARAIGLAAAESDPRGARPSTDLRAWWGDAVTLLGLILPRGVALEGDIPPDCVARISPEAVTQMVFNLVHNTAAALTPRGWGTVRIAARREDGDVVLLVEDDGPGMSAPARVRCTESFFSSAPRGLGTGLGLIIVGQLIRDAGGSISVRSAPGEGTGFTIRLAAAPERAAAPAATTRDEAVEPGVRASGGPIRVLMLEDEPGLRRGWARLFETSGDLSMVGMLERADDLAAAVEATGPDIVIVDLSMPGRCPLDALRELTARHPRVRAVVYSARSGPVPRREAFAAGAWAFVDKLAQPAEMFAALRRVAGGERLVDARCAATPASCQ